VTSGCDYRRFQISLDHAAIAKLPDVELGHVDATDANRVSELTDEELAMIKLDNVAYFPVMQAIGQAYVAFLRRHAQESNRAIFSYDLIDAHGRELLVTRSGDIERIARQMADPAFIDGLPG
jgi:hypothetical protein